MGSEMCIRDRSIMTTFGTARFSELVSGIQIFTSNTSDQQEMIESINLAGLSVFEELIFGALIFSLLALFITILSYYYTDTTDATA